MHCSICLDRTRRYDNASAIEKTSIEIVAPSATRSALASQARPRETCSASVPEGVAGIYNRFALDDTVRVEKSSPIFRARQQ